MGVKFAREYEDIHRELAEAIYGIEDVYEFFEMSADDWIALTDEERGECVRTLTDDVFYALGSDPRLEIGSGSIRYDGSRHIIKVTASNNTITIVKLI
jgi:hypothetical protein